MVNRKFSKFKLMLITVMIILTVGLTQCESKTEISTAQSGNSVEQPARQTSPDINLKTAIAQVARENIPAVVRIDVTQQQEVLTVSIGDPTPDQITSLKLQNQKGALVADVVPDGPAEEAGLQKDDLVVEYRGDRIEDAVTLRSGVANTPVGEEAALTVIRNGKPMPLTVKIGNLEDAMKVIAASLQDRPGVVVRPVSTQEAQKYHLQSGLMDHDGDATLFLQRSSFRSSLTPLRGSQIT